MSGDCKVVVVGSGGREHALAWKLAQSKRVSRVIVAPGNSGMPAEWERWPFDGASKDSYVALARKCRAEKISLVVVGPDLPLALGIADVLNSHGVTVFGPKAAAAQIESSKIFAKEIMAAAGVPTAEYFTANTLEDAQRILKSLPWSPEKGWVVKADGLALGKGVQVCGTLEQALKAAEELISISGSLLIEEQLQGEEISWMAFSDGTRAALLDPARDYKRLLDGDQGPNTGGMGAISPVPGVSAELESQIRSEVFLPVLAELKKRGCEFRGLLYAGLMVNFKTGKFWVLEFNSRFGDPETQVLVPRVSDDLLDWCEASAQGDLSRLPERVPFDSQRAQVVVIAAALGYPGKPRTGDPIQIQTGLDPDRIFYAGVKEGAQTSGGRVLGVLGSGPTLSAARQDAYASLEKITFDGMQFRNDIGCIP